MTFPLLTAANDHFLFKIQEAFFSGKLPPLAWQAALVILGGAAGIGLLYFFIQKIFVREPEPLPLGRVTVREDVIHILRWALDLRSKVELSFERGDQSRQTLACSIVDLGDAGILLELPGHVEPSRAWIGRMAECYFRVKVDKRNTLFYWFSSTILDLKSHGDYPAILLAFPEGVDLKQKRRHLRIDPPSRSVRDLAIWTAKFGENGFERDTNSWGPPLIRMTDKNSPLHLINLSASGLRSSISSRPAVVDLDLLDKGQMIFIHLHLNEPSGTEPLDYWLLGRIQNFYIDSQNHFAECGVLFIARGEVDPSSPVLRSWATITPEEGINDLESWVFKRHLELYRDKGLVL